MTTGRDEEHEDRTQLVRHIKADGSDRQEADTDDLPTYFGTRTTQTPFARLVVVGGPGAGNVRPVYPGTNSVGRDGSNRVPLDFGDDTISRKQHAVVLVDDRSGRMSILDGGKVNPIVVNGAVVAGEAEIRIGDTIEVGTTTLLVQGA